MTHVDLLWERVPSLGPDVLRVELLAGPDAEHTRHAGFLYLHATEVNALDRLLTIGARFERPATTYRISQAPASLEEVPA